MEKTDTSPWPNNRRSIYEMKGDGGDSSTKCFVHHVHLYNYGYGYLSQQYKRAADIIVQSQISGGIDGFMADGLFMPVTYLYRHALELILKSLLEKIVRCNWAHNEKPLHNHSITALWEAVVPAIRKRNPGADNTPLTNTESLIKDFKKLDKSGQSLRYHKLKNGTDATGSYPPVIDLSELKKAFNEIYSFLSGCVSQFDYDDDPWRQTEY